MSIRPSIRHDRKIGVAYAAALREAQLHLYTSDLISGLFQPNIGRHQIENCIHYTVRLLSHAHLIIIN